MQFKKYIFILTIYLFFSLSLFFNKTQADNFGGTRDYLESQLYFTTIISIGGKVGEEIQYDENLVEGLKNPVMGENIFWNELITEKNGRYRRQVGVNDSVVVGPNTQVKIHMILKNEANHDIHVNSGYVFASKHGHNNEGDSWDKFGFSLNSTSIASLFNSELIRRISRAKQFFPVGWNIQSGNIQMFEVETFEIKPSITILNHTNDYYFLEGELIVTGEFEVKNNLNTSVNEIEYYFGEISNTINFTPNELKTITYEKNYGKEYNIGRNEFDNFEIKVPSKKVCIVEGTTLNLDNYLPESRSAVILRSDEGTIHYRTLKDVDWYPEEEGMCIEVLEYSFKEERLELEISSEVLENVKVSFKDYPENISLGEDLILNIEIENTGEMVLNNFGIYLEYDGDFQKFKSSNCVFRNNSFLIDRLLFEEKKICEIKFEVLELEKFLKLENKIIVNLEEREKVKISYMPDIEVGLEYKGGEFVFNTSYENLSKLKTTVDENCKKFTFLSFVKEICYYQP